MKSSTRTFLAVGLLGLAVGCGAPSNESASDIEGTAATEGLNKGTPPPSNPEDYAKQQASASGPAQYGQQGYPGR